MIAIPSRTSSGVALHGGTTWVRLKCTNGQSPSFLHSAAKSAIGLASAPVASAPVTTKPVTIEQTATPAETVKQATHPEVAPVVQGLPSAVLYELPVDRLQQVAHDSGLIWVNSDAEKIAAVQAAIASEPPVVRIPSERPDAVVVNEGPLVLVETR